MSTEVVAAPGLVPGAPTISEAEERVSVATQWQLVWWRFRKHRLAVVSAVILMVFYFVVAFADFLAYAAPLESEAQRGLIPPQPIHFTNQDGDFGLYVDALVGTRDPQTFKRVYVADPNQQVAVQFFARGFEYRLFGFLPLDRHLLGIDAEGKTAENSLFLLGTDVQGRDLWSRLMYGTQVSLLVGCARFRRSHCGWVLPRPCLESGTSCACSS
jgi:peptide/nickel transport system permease protein